MDLFEKCGNFSYAREVQETGLYPYFIPLSESEGTVAKYNGKSLIMCGSNNYLGLTTHPDVQEAARQAITRFGTSCTGSRFLNGTLELHEKLESELADWVQKEAALIFSTGMQVNLGTISSLVARKEYIILDREDHASIVDGARLSLGKLIRYRHNDMKDLVYSAWREILLPYLKLFLSAKNFKSV
jgi:7-keto-8-aminopelargonate synthetase-like enzyme